MPSVPRRPVSNSTSCVSPAPDIGFGIYDLRPLGTSAVRKAHRGRPILRPQLPQSGSVGTSVVEAAKSLKRLGDAAFTGPTSSFACTSPLPPRSQVESSFATPGLTPAASPLTRSGSAAPLSARRCGDGSAAAAALRSTPSVAHKRSKGPSSSPAMCSISATTYVEDRVRYLVHPVGTASLLAAPLQRILVDVLRILQQERVQLKGQRPCRRYSRSLGTGIDAEVTGCMVDAAQAPSLMAAANIFSAFIAAHPMEETALLSSTIVLVGAALAELVALCEVGPCGLAEPQLLSFLDAAIGVGHPGAMLSVAVCLREGTMGLQRETASSKTWLLCAASAGYLPAIHELGETYERGTPAFFNLPDEGSAEDASDWGEALRWYRQAAEAGYSPSQLNLGKLLLGASEHAQREGSAGAPEVEYLVTEAKRWLQACAAAGVEEAVRLLKRMEDGHQR
ncbi:hypothetical protein JKF63_06469 [Porcisia hertigi]|uniref:Sel1 repeat family protein n=1 Tax=Porcisia hertigi TaxID=2761500 RepID=A0A836LK43_9TRYP|nr:hypothetical protein JKF63_06469 [Porcisia hertigi]